MTTADLIVLKLRQSAARVALADAALALRALIDEAHRVRDEATMAGDSDVRSLADGVAAVAQAMSDECTRVAEHFR